ncbi:MAG: DEAD/DEAH box helicase family protein [Candidatus Wallbacteria bacterium]|nr:DEAD/DEAH box helicase family protein [Candidatus Wallbacteria bacterium]
MAENNDLSFWLNRLVEIEQNISNLIEEKNKVRLEIARLKEKPVILPTILGKPASDKVPETPDEKIALFLKLFRCREDIYPKYWENQSKGTKGYSPVCRNEWVKAFCSKPSIKCTECKNRAFEALNETAVKSHLEGRLVIGTYAIRENDTCTFLAVDFDDESWLEDSEAYRKSAREFGIETGLERSRSGNGAHAWIFFSEPVPACLARRLGTLILSQASVARALLSLASYDRFFPSQDYLPKGGFGNLIALPLQKSARENGNTEFLDEKFIPYENQWQFLARCRMISCREIETLLNSQNIVSDSSAAYEEHELMLDEKTLKSSARHKLKGCYPGQVVIAIDSQIRINLEGLPQNLINALKNTAVFANPKFYELQRLRFSTWKTPRYIFCGELLSKTLLLPRGVLDTCLELLGIATAKVSCTDNRENRKKIKVKFLGKLLPEQKSACAGICEYETGVLVAPPGAGKTVIACQMIGTRKLPTLILTHRSQLLEQWRQQLKIFLSIKSDKIGAIRGSKKKATGFIDLAMLQTISKLEDTDFLSQYGQVIVDECHHIPAFSFESVMKKIPAKFVLGLTATPYRKDGHQPIIHMQCGPVRYEMKELSGQKFEKKAIVKKTGVAFPADPDQELMIQEFYEIIVNDRKRLELIADDVAGVIADGGFPLVLSERKEHLNLLSVSIRDRTKFPVKEFILAGSLNKRTREQVNAEISECLSKGSRPFILATGQLIGEGFNLPVLDTLFLAMPFSFKGKLVQYAGRIQRDSAGKKTIIIYDYLDEASPLALSMFRKRRSTYRKLGYKIIVPGEHDHSFIDNDQLKLPPAGAK